MPRLDAAAARRRLVEGNERFVAGLRADPDLAPATRMRQLLRSGQDPAAVVLSCSDSRVPAEILFDQGLGDLFVVRVAGNVIAPSLVGSVEFAVASFGTELVVVMGHAGCGAVLAALHWERHGRAPFSVNVRDVVERVRPAVAPLVARGLAPDELLAAAVEANVLASVRELRGGSDFLRERLEAGALAVDGAVCDLATGRVTWLEAVD